jgi:hypothetical protein
MPMITPLPSLAGRTTSAFTLTPYGLAAPASRTTASTVLPVTSSLRQRLCLTGSWSAHDWIMGNLSSDEQCSLVNMMANTRKGAADEEAAPSFDPNATRFGPNGTVKRKVQLNAGGSAMDAKSRRQIA